MKTFEGVKRWLIVEEARLKARLDGGNVLAIEYTSLQGSLLTVRKLLEAME